MNTAFIATAWRSAAATQTTGVTYGLRFGNAGRMLVKGRPAFVTLVLHNGPTIRAVVTDGFWKHCPEVRDRQISEWFRSLGLTLPWPQGQPYRFIVSQVAVNSFRVEPSPHVPS